VIVGAQPVIGSGSLGGGSRIRDSAKFLAFMSPGSKWHYFGQKVVSIGCVISGAKGADRG
jgi:hypothetical protein